MRFTPVFLLLLLVIGASAQRPAYWLTTNWGPLVQQQGTNLVTNMVARVDAELVPPSMLQPPAAPVAAATAPQPDSDLGFIITTITTLIASLLAAWAKWQERRKHKLNTVLGQNIETSLEVVEAQPNGKELALKLKDEIQSQQVDAGVKKMATAVHDEQINTMDAKESAERVMKA